jgi:hypothetical protein
MFRQTAVALVASAVALGTARAQQDSTAAKALMDPENPIGFMIQHRSDLSLADSQVTRLGQIGAEITMRNRPLTDSLNDLRPRGDKPAPIPVNLSPTQRDSLFAQRRAAARVAGEIHDNNRAGRERALAVLTPDQRNRLRSIEERLEADARMKAPPGDRMRPPGAGAPGGASGAQPNGYGGRPY